LAKHRLRRSARCGGTLADFYGSPVGKSAMQKFGAYMADLMPVLQAEIIKAQAKMNQSMPNQSPR
jgi:hypothetical protein